MFNVILDFFGKKSEGMLENILNLWDTIKHIFLEIVNFLNNIIGWFQNPQRLKRLELDKDLIAASIKRQLENGEYRVINCLYNQRTETVEDTDNNALGIQGKELDTETKESFGEKDMIILQ